MMRREKEEAMRLEEEQRREESRLKEQMVHFVLYQKFIRDSALTVAGAGPE